MDELEKLFNEIGGTFVKAPTSIKQKLQHIKALVFDWDGVFNNGEKQAKGSSNFSEVDSMGTNLMRYSYFMKHKQMPVTAIISGEKNETAFYFCERECFQYSFFKISDKAEALKFICEKELLKPENIAYVFDDVLDLPIAELCGLRILVNQKANVLFKNYCVKHNMVDYITASSGGDFAVREAMELLMGLQGNFEEVISNRKTYSEHYAEYIEKRRTIKTEFFTLKDKVIEKS